MTSPPQPPPGQPPQHYGPPPQQYGAPQQPPPGGPSTGPQPTAGPTNGPATGPQPTVPESVDRPGPNDPPPPPYGIDERGRVKRTKVSGVWIGLIAAAIVLILLIIFIAQNLNRVGIHFLGFYGRFSLGLAILVAAICGVLMAAVPGTVRILQLRRSLRRNVELDQK